MKFKLNGDEIFRALKAIDKVAEIEDIDADTGVTVARIARGIRTAAVDLETQRMKSIERFTVRFPEGHAKAGQPTPVYKEGMPHTDENIVPAERNITDYEGLVAALKPLSTMINEIDVPSLTMEQLKPLRLSGKIIEPLLWNIDAEPVADLKPEERRRRRQRVT